MTPYTYIRWLDNELRLDDVRRSIYAKVQDKMTSAPRTRLSPLYERRCSMPLPTSLSMAGSSSWFTVAWTVPLLVGSHLIENLHWSLIICKQKPWLRILTPQTLRGITNVGEWTVLGRRMSRNLASQRLTDVTRLRASVHPNRYHNVGLTICRHRQSLQKHSVKLSKGPFARRGERLIWLTIHTPLTLRRITNVRDQWTVI